MVYMINTNSIFIQAMELKWNSHLYIYTIYRVKDSSVNVKKQLDYLTNNNNVFGIIMVFGILKVCLEY